MEKIKVNMSPNPLDVQTIHASQNDTEAREWEFELHNNGELIDTSEITEQLVFKAYKGGTEQILPENTSTPTTSPFLGDIKYPQGLLTNQEFTYRQSPTQSDGNAKIQAIYGNTLKWNQLVQNGDFADGTNYFYATASTITASNGILTITKSQNTWAGVGYARPYGFTYTVGHKYLARVDYKGIAGKMLTVFSNSPNAGMTQVIPTDENWHSIYAIFNVSTIPSVPGILWLSYETTTDDNVAQFRNYAIFDLTAMGLDSINTIEEFTSLFPLPYYAYNQGSLLSFNGNGIKTVGKNLFDLSQFANGTITFENGVLNGTGAQFHSAYGTYATAKKLNCPRCSQITISFDAWTDQNAASTGNGLIIGTYHYDGTYEDAMVPNATGTPRHFTLQRQDIEKIGWSYGTQGANRWHVENFQVEFGTETSYEPYTESTLSLPISTYFHNGMKSAGYVYDELTESKAITRVGMVDLGTLNWFTGYNGFAASLTNVATASNDAPANMICTKYPVNAYTTQTQKSIARIGSTNYVRVLDSDYESASALKSALSGVYLYYELATPTETSFTTASLVTENAEIPLSSEDGTLIGKCTEQLSENPGFIDAKIKLADGDGTCYSNKLQLHIERSPQ